MKIILVVFLVFLTGCKFRIPQLVNDPPRVMYSIGFPGRVEKLEDALFSSGIKYGHMDFEENWQIYPEYLFTLERSDTIINYIISLTDCQSIYYLVHFEDDWKCDSSYVNIESYTSNKDSLPQALVEQYFNESFLKQLRPVADTISTRYHWEILRGKDTTIVNILDQADALRKQHIYTMDSVGNSLADKEIYSFQGDSVVVYRKMAKQRYIYLESRTVLAREEVKH